MAFVKYTTNEGDTWYNIAYRAYGDATLYAELIEANPTLPIEPVLPGNLEMLIPVKDITTAEFNLLPPWKK